MSDISALAAKHKIADPAVWEQLIEEAAQRYGTTRWVTEEGYDGTDTLDKIEKPISALLDLLGGKVNSHRLVVHIAGVKDGRATNDFAAIGEKFEHLLPFLQTIRSAAREAHRTRPPQRPKAKEDLASAYDFLVEFWAAVNGDEFSNGWEHTDKKNPPIPTSSAACFIYDAMMQIDPERERLAEELRDLMARTVAALPGRRRGRARGDGT